MDELCDDLLLLAARPDGTLALPGNLRFGVPGAELVRLAAARRVDIEGGRIVVLDITPTGDELLDAALASMAGGRRGPSAKAWVARHRPGLVHLYLARAAAAGTIRSERGTRLGFIPVTRWLVTDTARAAAARARLEAVAMRHRARRPGAGRARRTGGRGRRGPGGLPRPGRPPRRASGCGKPPSATRPRPRRPAPLPRRPRATRPRPPPTRPPGRQRTRPPGRRWTRPSVPPPTRRSARRSTPPPMPPSPPPPRRRTARPTTAARRAATIKARPLQRRDRPGTGLAGRSRQRISAQARERQPRW